jgi:manganese transport protein
MFPYEVYFYSSGGIEEEWGPKDLLTNRMTSIVGFGLGSLLAIAILAKLGAIVRTANVDPEIPGSAALEAAIPFGRGPAAGAARDAVRGRRRGGRDLPRQRLFDRAILRLGMGPHKKPWEAPRFTIAWIILVPARARDRPDRRRS